jgi:hypothetical protein
VSIASSTQKESYGSGSSSCSATQPVYGAVAANEGGRSAIVDQGIVLYGERRVGSSGRLHRPIRLRADARVCPLHARLDGRSLGPGRDDPSIRGQLPMEFAHDVRNDILDRATHVDVDRIFVGIRLLQDAQLAVE